jgi:hypothetical protein
MSRTLLPVFSKYSTNLGLDSKSKEPVEDFSFLNYERSNYETFRAGLDGIPGSREYLKAKTGSFFDPMGKQILCAAGDHHSGASSSGLAWSYKNLLNDWDGWVKAVKLRQAKDVYTKAQLERPSTWGIMNADTDEKRAEAVQRLRAEFSLTYSDEEIVQMVSELVDEFNETSRLPILRDEEERFQMKLDLLDHHYEHPQRWDDCGVGKLKSSLFGSIYEITDEMFVAMEKKYPLYRSHINNLTTPHVPRCACGICHKKRVADGTQAEYSAWVKEETDKVLNRYIHTSRCACCECYSKRVSNGTDGEYYAWVQEETDTVLKPDFVKQLFKTVQGVNFDDKCPHGLPFYACMSCSH